MRVIKNRETPFCVECEDISQVQAVQAVFLDSGNRVSVGTGIFPIYIRYGIMPESGFYSMAGWGAGKAAYLDWGYQIITFEEFLDDWTTTNIVKAPPRQQKKIELF